MANSKYTQVIDLVASGDMRWQSSHHPRLPGH